MLAFAHLEENRALVNLLTAAHEHTAHCINTFPDRYLYLSIISVFTDSPLREGMPVLSSVTVQFSTQFSVPAF